MTPESPSLQAHACDTNSILFVHVVCIGEVVTAEASVAGCWPPGILCRMAAGSPSNAESSSKLGAKGSACLSCASSRFDNRGTTFARVCASVASLLRKLWMPCRLSIAFCFLVCSASLLDACRRRLS